MDTSSSSQRADELIQQAMQLGSLKHESFQHDAGVTAVDMVLVLSSELVCQIAEKYFNSTMLKKKVKVIDLQATSNGLVQFNVAFVVEEVKPAKYDVYFSAPQSTLTSENDTPRSGMQREKNGRFGKVEKS